MQSGYIEIKSFSMVQLILQMPFCTCVADIGFSCKVLWIGVWRPRIRNLLTQTPIKQVKVLILQLPSPEFVSIFHNPQHSLHFKKCAHGHSQVFQPIHSVEVHSSGTEELNHLDQNASYKCWIQMWMYFFFLLSLFL